MWFYLDNPITSEQLDGFKSFVYIITNTVNGKQYIGKKKLTFIRRRRIKDSKRRKTFVKESDWQDYYGSSELLSKDLVKFGKDGFKREILHLCSSHTEATYLELKEQVTRDVLLKPAEYYNSYVGCRLNRTHLIGKQID
jgi:hypothetical protein